MNSKTIDVTPVYCDDNNFLNFTSGRLATQNEFECCDRSIGSIFEALESKEKILLQEGVFVLDDELDLILL